MKLATKISGYIQAGKIVEYKTLQSLGLTTDNSLRVILSRLSKRGEIYNPRRGTYVSKDADPFWVATALAPGYISLTSALCLHHLLDEYPFTIFVASEKRYKASLGQHEIRCFKAKNYSGVEHGKYPVASVEKALADCLLHPELVGYPRICKALHDAKISKAKFIPICRNWGGAFFQRLGYLLSLLPEKDREKTSLMNSCKSSFSSNIHLSGRKKGVYSREWKIIDNIGKEVLLSWWRQ